MYIAAWSPRVYPRVGGGNGHGLVNTGSLQGLSPRGRGKHCILVIDEIHARSIPAWAGETNAVPANLDPGGVYPRVGGGNPAAYAAETLVAGLSPRGRGKPCAAGPTITTAGSIPAWAGETQGRQASRYTPQVYPRVGGGNRYPDRREGADTGLSPRGRGKRLPPCPYPAYSGSIPAWAGETADPVTTAFYAEVYPRVGGGNDQARKQLPYARGLSPRGRGKHDFWHRHSSYLGSIPAWAGETLDAGVGAGQRSVYPRVGGGNKARQRRRLQQTGLSPRGRGKL